MIPSLSDESPDGGRVDEEVLSGFPPQCPACTATMQPHAHTGRAWWRCEECALPLIG